MMSPLSFLIGSNRVAFPFLTRTDKGCHSFPFRMAHFRGKLEDYESFKQIVRRVFQVIGRSDRHGSIKSF